MATTLESEMILQAAVTGIPRIATTIAEIPAALRERAFAAVARSYQQTVQELGHPEVELNLDFRSDVAIAQSSCRATKEPEGGG